jgi:hydroxymethylbilane synthase
LDILVHKGTLNFLDENGTIATGSLRRQAQWLNKYPNHKVVDLRGNVNTRMQKLNESDWNGAVFAAAGLERINLKPILTPALSKGEGENRSFSYIDLDWMIPAPAQGAMVIVAMQNDDFCKDAVAKLNHKETEICTQIERQFLKTLEGGCTAPIGALAKINNNEIHFVGNLLSIDGKEKLEIERTISLDNWTDFGKYCADEILEKGGAKLMKTIKETLKN